LNEGMLRALFRHWLVLAIPFVAACAGVLGIKPREASHPFEHRAHVLKGIACVQCHAGIVAAEDEGPLHIPGPEQCRRCHEQPHDTRACGDCHGTSYARQGAELARRHLKFEHRKHVAASGGECVRCHAEVGEQQPETLRPRMASCFGCHQHEGQWAARDCEGCHVDLPGERVMPSTHVVHEGDFVREHGVRAASMRDLCSTCHAERFCAGCHGVTAPALPAKLAFDAPRLSGLHRAGFRSRHSEEARGQPGLCTSCHGDNFCRECHAREHVGVVAGARSPHPAGWLTSTRGGGEHGRGARVDPVSCAGCHGGAGEQLCVGCHRVGGPGGNPHGPGFSSTKDKRADLPCRLCHAP
jgi:predicted CXXCH cytochrome family protein